MDYKKTLDNLELALSDLKEENKKIPIVVEGDKDITALHILDINKTIISLNSGLSLTDFCDKLAQKYKEIILLTDWDKKGGYLCGTIVKNLQGRVKCNTRFREIFAKNAMVRKVESLPSWINTIQKKMEN